MNKIKKIWTENKILLVLAVILIVCLVIFLGVSIKYFYGSNSNKYGSRLDSIKDTPLSEELFKDIENKLKESESVSKVTTNLQGKVVYITISYNEGTKLDDAKNVAAEVISLFNEDELQLYDLEFTIKSNEFTLMGARNSNGSGTIVWANNTPIESAE